MADWRINEKYRKPRRAKGTPFYTQRNYYAFGVLAFGAASWFLYEIWSATGKLRSAQLGDEKFKTPEGLVTRIKHIQVGRMNAPMDELLTKVREREAARHEDQSKPQSWLSKTISSTSTEPTSKYFANKKINEDNVTSTSQALDCLDSPYKNSLRKIKLILPDVDNCEDFKTPKAIKKAPKILPKCGTAVDKQSKKRQTKRSTKHKKSYKNTLTQTIKDNFGQTDVNAEHLQMALALSKSTYAAENPEICLEAEEVDLPSFLAPDKIPSVKTTLERFGFKSDRKWEYTEVPKKNKNSRFRYITPILQTRTSEEREEMIVSKISLIISQAMPQVNFPKRDLDIMDTLCSDLLNKYYDKKSVLYSINKLSLEEADTFNYYNKYLNLPPGNSQCGCLLKKWEEIPGRDKTPERKKLISSEHQGNYDTILLNCSKDTNVTDINLDNKTLINDASESQESTTVLNICSKETYGSPKESPEKRNSISPDLFGSESETAYSPKTPDHENSLSQSLLDLTPTKHRNSQRSNLISPQVEKKKLDFSNCDIFKTNTGIEHFESYCSDLRSLSQEVYDLTQSSEDEDTEELYKNSIKDHKEAIVYDSSSSNDAEIGNKNMKPENVTEENSGNSVCSKAFDTNFDMSPLQLKKSDEFLEDYTLKLDKLSVENAEPENLSINCSKRSSVEMDDLTYNCTKLLNVTDFVNEILNQEAEKSKVEDKSGNFEEDNSIHNADRSYNEEPLPIVKDFSKNIEIGRNSNIHNLVNNEDCHEENVHLSQGSCSQDSIVISDEELNYSSLYSKHAKAKNDFPITEACYDHIEADADQIINDHEDQMKSGIRSQNMSISLQKDVNISHGSSSQESIVINDEELNYSTIYSKNTNNIKDLYSLSDTEEFKTNIDKMDIEEIENVHSVLKDKYRSRNITPVVHNRIIQLKKRSFLKRQSLANEFLEDSFNDLLQDTGILETIENEAKQNKTENKKECSGEASSTSNCPTEDNFVTPEKASTLVKSSTNTESISTPGNNLIIKTNNITPMANYEEMDTPKIANELQKFGLKPLKRQRGAKLLKYLYECTHPLVEPNEIEALSSDEDDHRVIKKKKLLDKMGDVNNIDLNQRDHGYIYKDDIEIVGDVLLEKEHLEDLIFERKYSVKIPSCRVPLQIVWHNFLAQNPEIRENVLLYEPLQLEVVHSMLKEQSGCKFHIQDLLTFFDKKCITIRTAQAQGGRRRAKKK